MNIGVLICTYHRDSNQYLDDMFRSVFSSEIPQDCNLRVYLHQDGEICSEKSDIISRYPIFKILRSEKSVGLAKGLNKLIAVTEDEDYYFRMDADDIQSSDRFVHQIGFMETHPNVDFSGGGIKEFEGDITNVVQERFYPKTQEGIVSCISKSSPFAHVTVCFRAGFFDKFGEYPENYPLNEDIALWLQSLQRGAKGSNIHSNCVYVRMDDAYSRRSYKKAINEFQVFFRAANWNGSGRIYPCIRFIFRLFPNFLVKKIYNSNLRKSFLEGKSL